MKQLPSVLWFKKATSTTAIAAILGSFFLLLALVAILRAGPADAGANDAATTPTAEQDVVSLQKTQLEKVEIGPVEQRSFEKLQDSIGIIDFNQDRALSVFSPYQGRIASIRVRAGDTVSRGQVLYTVLIPDLAQAVSTLVSAAATLRNADSVLERATRLRETDSVPVKEYEQNLADQQTAETAYQTARKSMALFGLTDADVARIEKSRQVTAEMEVRSPLNGRVTARAAAEGLLVQPGSTPAPVTVADLDSLWMVASIPESDIAGYRIGQPLKVQVQAYPGKFFEARIDYIGDVVDANTHRVAVRAAIPDPQHQLKPQMTATFRATLGAAQLSPAVPDNAVVREGDGSLSVWVSTSEGSLRRRVVQAGLRQDGWVQILDGLKVGESIARSNALYLSNLNSSNVH